ncbi:MAG: flagellar basal body P-ring formation chaperone FlgA [Pseudomonadota bacterium]
MIRLLLAFWFSVGLAFASGPVDMRIADAIRLSSGLPDTSYIDIVQMTPVRGSIDRVTITRFDRRTGNFTAVIGLGQREARVQGQARVSVPIVVAANTLRRDHEISGGDIELRHIPLTQVSATALAHVDDAIGMATRRTLVAGRPIREEDVGPPIVLKKNGAIEIVYARPGISLSMRGRALEDGAVGEAIRVKADGEGRIVVGEVVSADRVVVN